ncbi:hypothetical protein [Nannocystis sp. SCPEA4]|uniref:hypothetical protein n=1 Tax=Nannocystis sp. SCPEA4 TaxID=2996787 RepID=UPI0022720C2F|nr:hypothetical protein [Nannocystis sp. SCPEA4]MCY1055349.1 hypothetical protein [Nannocystis sp. SCPEA4]
MTRSICVSVALAIGGCRPAEVPMAPSQEVQRQSALGNDYIAAEERKVAAAAELEQAEAARADIEKQIRALEQYAADEQAQYTSALAEAQEVGRACRVEFTRLVQLHRYLAQFVAEPQRDAAIEALERCRTAAAASRTQEHTKGLPAARQAFARAVVQGFDESSPHAKGRLTAAVKGTTLRVELRRHAEWQSNDCQREVDAWCASGPPFTAIELHGPQGAFRCRPAATLEEHVAALVRADGLAESWVPVASGRFATPGPGVAALDSAELARLRGNLDGATQRVQAGRAAHTHASEDVDAVAAELRGLEEAGAADAEHRNFREKKKYNRMVIASIPLNLGAVVFVLVGLFSLTARQNIVDGTRQFDSPSAYDAALRRTTRNTIIGYGVGLPLVAVGLTLALVGARRLHRLNRLTLSGDGIGLRF